MYTYFTTKKVLLSVKMTFIFLFFLSFLTQAQIAPVYSPSGGFHVDGNLISNAPTTGVGDWVPGNSGAGGNVFSSAGVAVDPVNSFLVSDAYSNNADDVFSGSALNDNPNVWKWVSGSAPSKNEIHRGLIHFSKDITDNTIWIMMGADRLSTNGTSYIDFELLQNTMTKTANGGFASAGPNGGRTVNDLLITVLYENGGGLSTIVYNRWLPNTSGGGFSYQPIPAPGPFGFAATNSSSVAVPFGAFGATTYSQFQFVEAAVNLNGVIAYGSADPCAGLNIKTIFIKTKASTSTTAALKDFIDPLQVSLIVGNVQMDAVGTVCLNASPISLNATPSGGTFSGTGVNGSIFTPSIAGVGVHKIIYTKEVIAGCFRKDSINITVQALSVGGTVSSSASVCTGVNSGTLTLSSYVGDIVKWQSSTDGTNYSDIANTTATQNYTNLTQTTYYRAVVKNGACGPENATPAIITVNPGSVGGSVASNATVCSGSNSGTLTLSGNTGTVVRWESSTNSGSSWTPISNTTTTQSYLNITTATQYRAVVKSGVCNEANSGAANITVNPVSVGGTVASNATVCSGSNGGTLTLSGNTGTVVRWESSTNGGSSWSPIANTTTSQAYTNITSTTQYRAVVKSGECDAANSSSATITIETINPGHITGSILLCDNVTDGKLVLVGYTGTIIKWVSSTDGVNYNDIPNSDNDTLYLGILTQRTYYKVLVQSGLCQAEYSPAFNVTIISCGPTTNHCTYTQGFYGNVGGLGCSGAPANALESAKTKMQNAFDIYGQTKVVFGRADIGSNPANDRAFTLFKDDIINNSIFKMLPGGGTSMVLGVKPGGSAYTTTFDGATYTDQSTWSAVPIIVSGSNRGRIKNSLLAQTITLFFNMYNGTNLGNQALHDTFYITRINCSTGDPIPGDTILAFGMPRDVIVFMTNNATYSKDVAGLFKLANDVLGGLPIAGLNASHVIDAVDKINNAFDGCRSVVATYDVPDAPVTPIATAVPYFERGIATDEVLFVKSFPNPYKDRINFTILSKVNGHGTLELYNMLGQKVSTIFDGIMIAGIGKTINYEVPKNNWGTLTYLFRMGAMKTSGKLINLIR